MAFDALSGLNPYETLQLDPKAHPLIVMKAFRTLAAMYHPDNKQTGNREKFEEIVAAYRILSDPLRRHTFDRAEHSPGGDDAGSQSSTPQGSSRDQRQLRDLILTTLYNVRRNAVSKPGLSLWVLADMTDCHVDEIQFSLWYLRGKKLIETEHDDSVAITVVGVDYVEANMSDDSDQMTSLPVGQAMLNPAGI